MSEENSVRARLLPDGSVVQELADGSTGPLEDTSDWERVRNMTEEEVIANAQSDPDNSPLTDEDFAKMERIPNVYVIRNALGLTQLEFAETYGIALELVQGWERGPGFPDSVARSLLRIIEQDPEGAKAALVKSYRKAT